MNTKYGPVQGVLTQVCSAFITKVISCFLIFTQMLSPNRIFCYFHLGNLKLTKNLPEDRPAPVFCHFIITNTFTDLKKTFQRTDRLQPVATFLGIPFAAPPVGEFFCHFVSPFQNEMIFVARIIMMTIVMSGCSYLMIIIIFIIILGNLRFMPPVTVSPWREVLRADTFGPVCPQNLPEVRMIKRMTTMKVMMMMRRRFWK